MKLASPSSYLARARGAAPLAVLLAIGCGESHITEQDAQIVFDATFPDAGTDAGPPPSNVGTRCETDDDCAAGGADSYCEANLGGYCTTYCDETVACPSGSVCVALGGGLQLCLAECEFGADEDQCPAGNGCSPGGMGLSPVCLPGCEDASDCATGDECDLESGFAGAGACFDPSVPVGATCQVREECGTGADCLTEGFNGWPGGYCAGLSCDPATNTGCTGDGVCAETTSGGGLCLDGCASDTDCRTAYRCRPLDRDEPDGPKGCFAGCTDDSQCTVTTRGGVAYTCNPGTGYCARPLDAAELGDACNADDFRDCRGGRCIGASEGWPGGMCTYPGCSLSGATPSATCPTDSVCTDDGGGDPDLGVCVPSCTVGETTCRTGYACVAVSDGSTEGACRPAPAT